MSSFTLSPTQKRAALLRARQDLEKLIYAVGLSLDLDLDGVDLTKITDIWTADDGTSLITGNQNAGAYNYLEQLAFRLTNIIDKLEGPNRVV